MKVKLLKRANALMNESFMANGIAVGFATLPREKIMAALDLASNDLKGSSNGLVGSLDLSRPKSVVDLEFIKSKMLSPTRGFALDLLGH